MTLGVRDLRKRFGAVEALRGVTFRVPEGATWGLLGPNGSGKTTTMRILLGMVPPDAGEVTWQGRPVARWPRSLWGYLPEERGLYPKLPVREQLAYLGRLQGLSARQAAAGADRWLRRLGMADAARRRLEQLSKGNQQKVQFAAAVVHEPAILLLDEPFSGLDPGNAATLKEVLQELRGDGRTILFSSHRLDHVRELCDGITLVHDGRGSCTGPWRRWSPPSASRGSASGWRGRCRPTPWRGCRCRPGRWRARSWPSTCATERGRGERG
ncbi:MAG: hypothetical protein DIU76_10435, partial [Bacillota bacterium]